MSKSRNKILKLIKQYDGIDNVLQFNRLNEVAESVNRKLLKKVKSIND